MLRLGGLLRPLIFVVVNQQIWPSSPIIANIDAVGLQSEKDNNHNDDTFGLDRQSSPIVLLYILYSARCNNHHDNSSEHSSPSPSPSSPMLLRHSLLRIRKHAHSM